MAAYAPTAHPRRRMPFTVYVLCALMLVKAAILFAMVGSGPFAGLTTIPRVQALAAAGVIAAIIAAFGVLLVLAVALMVLRRRTGWLLTMVLTGLFLLLDIYGVLSNWGADIWAVLNIVTVFYLNQSEVREVLGVTVGLGTEAAEARDAEAFAEPERAP